METINTIHPEIIVLAQNLCFSIFMFFKICFISKVFCNTIKDNIVLVANLVPSRSCMLKKSPVFWALVVLQWGLRTPSPLWRSQQETKAWSFWIHTPNSPLKLSQKLFIYMAAIQWRAILPQLVFLDAEKPQNHSQTTSQQAGNWYQHCHGASLLDFKVKGFWISPLKRTVFTTNSYASGTRNTKWGVWLLSHSEHSSEVIV